MNRGSYAVDDRGAETIKVLPAAQRDVKTPYTDDPPAPAAGSRPVRGAITGAAGRLADADQRARLAPPALTAAALAAGGFIDSPVLAFTAAAATAAGYAVLRLRRGATHLGLAYAAITSGFAGTWSAAIAANGLTWNGPGDAYMLAGATLLAAPHAWRHRWRYQPEPQIVPEPVKLPEFEEISEFQEIWQTYVAVPGRPGADMRLTPEWGIPGGTQADIIVPRGLKSTDDAIALTRLICSAYDKPSTQAFVEPTPEGRETRARLTVLDRDVLAKPRLWTGPTLNPETGVCVVGNFPDAALTHWKFWTPGSGAANSLIAGEPGSGKSRFGDKLQAEMHQTPLIVSWVADPQEGQSLFNWQDAVDRFAMGGDEDIEEIMRMLRALRRITFRRSSYFSPKNYTWVDEKGRQRRGKGHFDPTPEMPLLIATLEEAHVVVKDPEYGEEALTILGDVGKLGRKVGVGLILVNQLPSLDELGGSKAQSVRAMLRNGNVVSFKTGESVSQHMLGLKSDPSKLPGRFADGSSAHGLGLINGVDGRDTPFRSEFIKDPYDVACLPAVGQLDALSLEAADAPDDPDRAPKSFMVPGFAKTAAMPLAKDRQNWAERILPLFGDGSPREVGAVLNALPAPPAGPSDRTVRWALKKLVEDGFLHTEGPKKPYVITDEGRAALGHPVPAVA